MKKKTKKKGSSVDIKINNVDKLIKEGKNAKCMSKPGCGGPGCF